MNILLSILIPTVHGRERELDVLLKELSYQVQHTRSEISDYGSDSVIRYTGPLSPVEIVIYRDNKTLTIGEKRERLYAIAKGEYSVQWDDDDFIDRHGVQMILNALDSKPDCVTYEESIDIDGKMQRSNHSLIYDDWADNFDGFDYVRTPFMKSVIKTSIARSVPIPHIRYAEDHQWAQALKPHLQTEVHIPEQIYKYIHRSTPFHERYGITQ